MTRARLHEAHDGLERRRLAGAVAAQQAEHLARRQLEGEIAQDLHLAIEAIDAGNPQHHAPRYARWTSGSALISAGPPSANMAPLFITVMRWASSMTTDMLCSIRSTV